MSPPLHQEPLSSATEHLGERHGVVVIGSGYGGAITARRLAEAGHSVTILERGREWKLGSLPQSEKEFLTEFKPVSHEPLSLFDYVPGDVDVLAGNGLGGTSLINAAVVLRPSDEVFQRACWPAAIRRAAHQKVLARFFDVVDEALEIKLVNEPLLPKTELHKQSAVKRGLDFKRVPIAVKVGPREHTNDQPTRNQAGVLQRPCIGCGNCAMGCNVGAKNTLAMNYLPLAKQAGARIFTQIEVDFVVPAAEGGWTIFARSRPTGAAEIELTLHAKVVILAAGTLGSTGILLRSREQGLRLPAKLGSAFSSNGDLSGFAYNTPHRADSAAFDARQIKDGKVDILDAPPEYEVGPAITSMIDRRDLGPEEGFIVEDTALPSALVNLFRYHIPWFGVALRKPVDQDLMQLVGKVVRVVRDQISSDPKGAVNHSMVYLAMGHDGAAGKVVLDPEGQPKVLWGWAGRQPVFERISKQMAELTTDLGGTYFESPRWSKMFGNTPITVHPLGGCPMGEDAATGVVDDMGRVFDPGGDFHQGLYVADGSMLPTSLGVNPLATISALSERIAKGFVEAHEKSPAIEPGKGTFTAPPRRPLPPGMEFTELLSGFVTRSNRTARTRQEYLDAERQGRAEGGLLRFRAAIFIDDVDEFIRTKEHEATVEGHVEGALFEGGPLVIEEGKFNLYIVDPKTESKRMIYRLRFRGRDARIYTLHGFKEVIAAAGVDAWSENTTLFTTLHDGPSEEDPVIAKGALHLSPEEFAKQLISFRVRRSSDTIKQIETLEHFGAFFFGELWDTYVRRRLRQR